MRLVGVEAGGRGIATGRHAARLASDKPSVGVLHGTETFLLQDEHGQVRATHSVSAGLDYPAIGPEHAWLHEQGLARYDSVTDEEALAAFRKLAALEGILPALETAHALAWLEREAGKLPDGARVIVNLSGRGDKDVEEALRVGREGFSPIARDRRQPIYPVPARIDPSPREIRSTLWIARKYAATSLLRGNHLEERAPLPGILARLGIGEQLGQRQPHAERIDRQQVRGVVLRNPARQHR